MEGLNKLTARTLICDEEVEMDDAEAEEPEKRARDEDPFSITPWSGGKRPCAWGNIAPYGTEDIEDAQEQPDLAEYFGQWVIPEKQIILVCRAYASYLSAKAHANTK